jgi:hypothetical protein
LQLDKADHIFQGAIFMDVLDSRKLQRPTIDIGQPVKSGALGRPGKHRLQKLAHAAEKAFTDRALLLDENRLLFEQKNKR